MRAAVAADSLVYLNTGSGGEAQTLVEWHENGHSLWGLGHASDATATLDDAGHARSFFVHINLRSLNFSGASHSREALASWDALSLGDDPYLAIREAAPGDADRVIVVWRQQTVTVPGSITVSEDPSDEFDALGHRLHSYIVTVSATLDLHAFNIDPTLMPESTPQMHVSAVLRMLDVPALDEDATASRLDEAIYDQRLCWGPNMKRTVLDEVRILRCGLEYERAPMAAALARFGIDAGKLASALPPRSADVPANPKAPREYAMIAGVLAPQNALERHAPQYTLCDELAAVLRNPDERLRGAFAAGGIVPNLTGQCPAFVTAVIPDRTSSVHVVGRAFSYDTKHRWASSRNGFGPVSSTFHSNIWDIVSSGTKLLLTSGNKNDAHNPGVPLVAYDPVHHRFTPYPHVISLQFQTFRHTLNGGLLIPAIEAVYETFKHIGGYYVGAYFSYDGKVWRRHIIPDVVHTYDVVDAGRGAGKGETIYAAVGAFQPGSVAISHDGGATWKIAGVDDPQDIPANAQITRALRLFRIGAHWYACMDGDRAVYRIEGDRLVREWVNLFPGADNGDTEPEIVERDIVIAHKGSIRGTLYIGADNVYDHQWEPFGLYFAPSIDRARHVPLPVDGILPYDIKVDNNVIYVLGSKQLHPGLYENVVFTSRDATTWKPAFRFTTKALARSFEIVNNGHDFYFGLGSLTDEYAPDSGLLLHLRV